MLIQKEVNKEKEKCRKWCSEFFIKNNKSMDMFDFNAEYDDKLSIEENKNILREKIKLILNEHKEVIEICREKIDKKEIQNYSKEFLQEQEQKLLTKFEEEAEAEFKLSIKKGLVKENLTKLYNIPIEYTKSVLKGFHNSFIFLGKQGQGKTTIVLKTLEQEKADYVYHSGISTPLSLYEFLYNNRDGKIIVFDDCAGLINNFYALSILLSALWSASDKRIVCWNSSKNLNVPKKFVFNSKIIIITNKMPNNDYVDVVMSRCLIYELKLSYNNLLEMMYSICKDKELLDYISEYTTEATKYFDLRLLKKAEKFKEFSPNWKELLKPLLEVDEKIELILQGLSQEEWCHKTGLSRRSYYNIKQKVQKCS